MKLINLLGLILIIAVAFAQARPNHHRRLKHHRVGFISVTTDASKHDPDGLTFGGIDNIFASLFKGINSTAAGDSTQDSHHLDSHHRAKKSERSFKYLPIRG